LKTLSKTMTERKNLNNEIYEEIRKGGKLPDIPLIVYTAMGIDPFLTPITSKSFLRYTLDPFNNMKKYIYKKLANSVPQGEHRILENAGHTTIHTDCSDEVSEAIRDLIDFKKRKFG
ncbi:MAG TPA: hypothetical protein VFL70_10945, partial [Bacteroidia bacterium]|nr:hypothetical protein [Bacteroidia bacterium]